MEEVKTTRNYKDTLFGSLFYTCDKAVENAKALYKALTGREVKQAEKCRLEDVLFRQFLNDVAYIMDGKFICFMEHQSTVNLNMALRLLIYLARTYERYYNILRMLGQETINQGKAPSKRIVSRKRIRTVIQNIIHFAGQLTKHARQLFLSISRSNAWADAFLGLIHRFVAC